MSADAWLILPTFDEAENVDEPVVGYGPFVMNTTREIQQAYADFHAGRLGTIPATEKAS